MKSTFSADGFTSRYEEAPYRERDLGEVHTRRPRPLNPAGSVKTETLAAPRKVQP